MTEQGLIRIVRMTLRPENVSEFLTLFKQLAPHVRKTEGCQHLELWRDARYPNIMTTYSRWTSPEKLNAYRAGNLFQENWAKARIMFAAPPFAASHTLILRAED